MYELELSVHSMVSYHYVLPNFQLFANLSSLLLTFCQYFASFVSCMYINQYGIY